jgi:two-component system CheB/CheR fusion protein
VKIYATDVDEDDLAQARRGVYTSEEIEGVPEDLRETYFDRQSNDHERYIFRQDLRRTLVFGRHDLMHDAPISRLDLLVCRNTLIYFNREAQERIVARFHFALKPHGYVFLGRAETMLTHGDLFEPVKMKHRVFAKVSGGGYQDQMGTLLQAGREIKPTSQVNANFEMLRAAFERSPTARLVVDSQGDLILASEEARERLNLDLRDLGRPFRDLEISYRPVELRSLIDQAREEHNVIRVEDVKRTRRDQDDHEYFDVSVSPLWGAGGRWIGAGITFRDVTERQAFRQKLEQTRHDLETAHEELQSTNEELETSNEELQSTVEELQTTNEELQSSNEEMETMNEELQSANAELQSINQELLERTRDLDRTNAFLESILASVEVGVVVIDREFEITLWNEAAEELWGLRTEEVVGRSLLELDIGLPVDELKEPVEQFLAGEAEGEVVSLEATNRRGQSIVCQVTRTIRRDPEGEPEGVVLVMETEQR